MGNISIHAPAQGATIIAHVYADLARDFNPRSRTGSDGDTPSPPGQGGQFQPTLPHRERQSIYAPPALFAWISTHAPAQGATRVRESPLTKGGISTHAPAQGATLPAVAGRHPTRHFNPRSRTGSDETDGADYKNQLAFQPTLPHRERQITKNGEEQRKRISTHAPAQGATFTWHPFPFPNHISTHAPAQGATVQNGSATDTEIFQPTLPHRERRGADRL